MTNSLLILRPQPGADHTAKKGIEAGLSPYIWPLFEVRPLSWYLPASHGATAILITSANAVRTIGGVVAEVACLPAYCVGSASAEAAEQMGFKAVFTGKNNAQEAMDVMAADGHRTALHFRGRDIKPVQTNIRIIPIITYAAEEIGDGLPPAQILESHIILVHSARAARRLADLVDGQGHDRATLRLVAISAGAARAAGDGWGAIALAKSPNDTAMIAAARIMAGN